MQEYNLSVTKEKLLSYGGNDIDYCVIQTKDFSYYVDIMKTNDDWFFVYNNSKSHEHTRKSYKCDQIDGVINLIRKLFIDKSVNESFLQDDKDIISDYCLTAFEKFRVKEGATQDKDNWDGYFISACRYKVRSSEYVEMSLSIIMWQKSIGIESDRNGLISDINPDKYGPFTNELHRLYDRIRAAGYIVYEDSVSSSLNRDGVCRFDVKIKKDDEDN
jgi:hypothetical protein